MAWKLLDKSPFQVHVPVIYLTASMPGSSTFSGRAKGNRAFWLEFLKPSFDELSTTVEIISL